MLAYYPSYQALYNDYDIWFHLTYGKHYVGNLTWHIDHSVYSWTTAFNPPGYVTWMGSSILYIIHKLFGITALFILQYLVLLASGAIIFRFAKAAGITAGLPLLAGLLLTAVTMGTAANYIKPEMFSILFVTLAAAFYLRFRMAPKPWVIAAFPALFMIWVNTHGLWQFGIIFLGIVFAVDMILYVIRPGQALDRRALIYLAIALVCTLLALCVNPFGASLITGFIKRRFADVIEIFFALKGSEGAVLACAVNPLGELFSANVAQGWLSRVLSLFSASGGGGSEALDHFRGVRAYINLWEHLFYGQKQPFLTMTAVGMTTMMGVFLAIWAVSWKRSGKADFPVAAANISFFFMAMFMGRLALVFSLIWMVSTVFLIWRAGPVPVFARAAGPLSLAAFVGLSLYVVAAATYIYEDRSWFGVGYEDYVPNREMRYIMDNDLPGPMFNDYLSGSYLMWTMYPEYKVAIDARHFPYRGRVLSDWADIGTRYPLTPAGLRAFMDKYPARIALIHHNYQNIIVWFYRSPDWVLAYFDTSAVVMIHKDVIPELGSGAIDAMHPPSHYKDVDNPIVFNGLFDVYQRFFGSQYASEIRDYYARNVPDRYWNKKTTLAGMDRLIDMRKQKERRPWR